LNLRFFSSLCSAPSIDDADGIKRADCLSLPDGRRVSARSGRFGDAQDQAEHGRFLLVRFSCACKKMNNVLKGKAILPMPVVS